MSFGIFFPLFPLSSQNALFAFSIHSAGMTWAGKSVAHAKWAIMDMRSRESCALRKRIRREELMHFEQKPIKMKLKKKTLGFESVYF